MRLRKSMSRIARTFSCSSTYSRIDSSGSIEIDQRFSSISTSWKPTAVWSNIREAFSCEETSQTIVRFPSAAARSPERHRDRRLADAALAGDDDQSLVEKFGDRAIPSNFGSRQEKPVPIRISAQWDF